MISKKKVKAGNAVDEYAYVPEGLKKFCVSIDSVRLYEKNPRRNDIAVEDLARLIKANMFRKPIVVDQHGIIRAGNTAYKAARKLNMRMIPVAQSDFTDEGAAVEYVISDNKAGERSEWDLDVLKELMVTHNLADAEHRPNTGLTQVEVNRLFDIKEQAEQTLKHAIEVAVTCESEDVARTVYDRLTAEGYKCRVLTL